MKTTYQKPETLLMEVATQQMMAGSDLIKNNQQNLGTAPTTGDTYGNLTRRTVWDDDEKLEEEY